jgi:hypothetical protein
MLQTNGKRDFWQEADLCKKLDHFVTEHSSSMDALNLSHHLPVGGEHCHFGFRFSLAAELTSDNFGIWQFCSGGQHRGEWVVGIFQMRYLNKTGKY